MIRIFLHEKNALADQASIAKILAWYLKDFIGRIRSPVIVARDNLAALNLQDLMGLGSFVIEADFTDVLDVSGLKNLCFQMNVNKSAVSSWSNVFNADVKDLYIRNIRFSLHVELNGRDDAENIAKTIALLNMDKQHLINLIVISYSLFDKQGNLCDTSHFGASVEKLMNEVNKINPRLFYAIDCAVNNCMLSKELLTELRISQKLYYFPLEITCLEPRLMINSDCSAAWCECFNYEGSPFFVPSIFAFKSFQALKKEFEEKMKCYHGEHMPLCNFRACSHHNCFGLCAGLSHVKENKAQVITQFSRSSRSSKVAFELGPTSLL